MKVEAFQLHRGYHHDGVAENSMEAIAQAHFRGVKMVEIDISMTSDGACVLCHDSTLERLLGSPERVSDIHYPTYARREDLALLRDVLLRYPDLKVNVELKWHGSEDKQKLVHQVLEVVKSLPKSQERVLFSCFRPEILRRIKGEASQYTCGFLLGRGSKIPWLLWPLVYFYSQADWLHLEEALITPKNWRWIKTFAPRVAAWTVNDNDRVIALRELGVDSIISDEVF